MEVQANSHLFRIRFNDERTKKDTISAELAMRITKVSKLKQRYETFSITLNTEKSNEDNVLAQAQYVIKSAQMKEDLLKQGDQLEALVIKAETELRALENTVQILKWNNTDVKKNFEKLNESSSEINEMKEFEEHLRAVTEQVKIRRKLLKDFSERHNSIKRFQQIIRQQRNIQDIIQDELDIDVRLQSEANNKIEQQLVSLCLAIGDDNNVIEIVEQLSVDQSFKITVKPSINQSNKQQCKLEKKTLPSLSNIDIIPNIVNISIDSSSRSTTSESRRSSKKST
ncbi:unnamed protein product [Rotaria sp. Silwood2]|nr:unnamed protein product [Rotaria sp. Silwood2]